MYSNIFRGVIVLCAIVPTISFSQILYSDGATIVVTNGGALFINGGLTMENGSLLTNNGELQITKNSSFALPGTITINNGCNAEGSGDYWIEQNWINNGVFAANNSSVYLHGNTEQLITTTNNTITEFNTLVLSGNGTGIDRRKSLVNVGARISALGFLNLNDRELATQTNELKVLNPDNSAVFNSLLFGNEGFVSSDSPGNFEWLTNSIDPYYFPVGSSLGTLRYRPVLITPQSASSNSFKVRFDNSSADLYNYFIAQHTADISTLNPLFFHSIEQVSGNSDIDLEIAYDPSTDGEWNMLGHWENNQDLWTSMAPASASGMGNYSSLLKSGWDFPDIYVPYILANSQHLISIPNVFTPNQDGINDFYLVAAEGITDYSIVIINRWGNVVFDSDDINVPWDGNSNGNACSEGVYFYIIRAKSGSEELIKQGNITLITN
jgi:gliding motility-associated-like protein